MIVIAFDVDGTVEFGNPSGPVKSAWLQRLDRTEGVLVVLVSSSGKGRGFVERILDGRLESLMAVKQTWPGAALYIYVSDNADEDLAYKADFVHVHPKNFRLPEP